MLCQAHLAWAHRRMEHSKIMFYERIETYFVLTEKWKVKNDLEWLGVSCEHDQVGKSFVQSFGCLIRSLLQLYHLTTGKHLSHQQYHQKRNVKGRLQELSGQLPQIQTQLFRKTQHTILYWVDWFSRPIISFDILLLAWGQARVFSEFSTICSVFFFLNYIPPDKIEK